jgi:hypothetical protein
LVSTSGNGTIFQVHADVSPASKIIHHHHHASPQHRHPPAGSQTRSIGSNLTSHAKRSNSSDLLFYPYPDLQLISRLSGISSMSFSESSDARYSEVARVPAVHPRVLSAHRTTTTAITNQAPRAYSPDGTRKAKTSSSSHSLLLSVSPRKRRAKKTRPSLALSGVAIPSSNVSNENSVFRLITRKIMLLQSPKCLYRTLLLLLVRLFLHYWVRNHLNSPVLLYSSNPSPFSLRAPHSLIPLSRAS